jgi:hypothetical protein
MDHKPMWDAWLQAEKEAEAMTWLMTQTGADQDDLTGEYTFDELVQAAVNSIKNAMLLVMAQGPQARHDAMTELVAEYGDDNGDCPDELGWAAVAGRLANWTWNEDDAWEYRTSVAWRAAKEVARKTGNTAAAEYAEEQEDFWSQKEEEAWKPTKRR